MSCGGIVQKEHTVVTSREKLSVLSVLQRLESVDQSWWFGGIDLGYSTFEMGCFGPWRALN
jgi:hypothetical protein